jgi:hypothetical protein
VSAAGASCRPRSAETQEPPVFEVLAIFEHVSRIQLRVPVTRGRSRAPILAKPRHLWRLRRDWVPSLSIGGCSTVAVRARLDVALPEGRSTAGATTTEASGPQSVRPFRQRKLELGWDAADVGAGGG